MANRDEFEGSFPAELHEIATSMVGDPDHIDDYLVTRFGYGPPQRYQLAKQKVREAWHASLLPPQWAQDSIAYWRKEHETDLADRAEWAQVALRLPSWRP